jgi:nanoRNase/pAp phosphatase (c-di-AMP/oligoRNAs hydrolase)
MLNIEEQIFKQIDKSKNILIIFKEDEDGDLTSSSLALFGFLKSLNKNIEIINVSDKKVNKNKNLDFLPNYNLIKNKIENIRRFIVSLNIKKAKISQIKYSLDQEKLNFIISPSSGWFEDNDVTTRAGEFKYDLIISLGIKDLESLGKTYDENIEFFYKTTIINIDNTAANEEYGQINQIDLNCSTISEIVYYLLKNYNEKLITEDIATCLLAGIIKKTKNFRTGNLTPETFLVSSDLINLKARRDEIINNFINSKSLDFLKVWGEILNNLHTENNGKIIWSKVRLNYQEIENNKEVLDDIVEELISNLPKAQLFFVLTQKNQEETKIYIYSLKNNINILDKTKEYNPQGNYQHVILNINKDFKQTEQNLFKNLLNNFANDIN